MGRLRCLEARSWSSVLHPLIKACPASEGHCILESPVQMTNMAIFVQVDSAGLELDCRCHGEGAEEEMQQAQMQE